MNNVHVPDFREYILTFCSHPRHHSTAQEVQQQYTAVVSSSKQPFQISGRDPYGFPLSMHIIWYHWRYTLYQAPFILKWSTKISCSRTWSTCTSSRTGSRATHSFRERCCESPPSTPGKTYVHPLLRFTIPSMTQLHRPHHLGFGVLWLLRAWRDSLLHLHHQYPHSNMYVLRCGWEILQ